MTELLTAAQMGSIERAAIEAGEVTGLDLMERAGRGVVDAILDWRPDLATGPRRAIVLCGPGNNGGDGFVVARLLHARGWEVEVFLFGRDPGEVDRLPSDAATNARRWAALGEIRPSTDLVAPEDRADLAIDALFGTGLARPVEGEALRVLETLMVAVPSPTDIVAVDLASGLCSDSGRHLAPAEAGAPMRGLTVSFHAAKLGHHLAMAARVSGRLVVAEIGLDRKQAAIRLGLRPDPSTGRRRDATPVVRLVERDRFVPELAGGGGILGKDPAEGAHKYTHGHALVLSGGVGRGGAARLAARGALRVGAGLVTVGCPPAALIENAARLDAIMLRAVGDAGALRETLSDPRINVVALGPGLGLDRARALVPVACEGDRAVVLDADALTAFADDAAALFAMLHGRCVLTPHEGEFGRLFPDLVERLTAPATSGPAYSKVDAAREAAGRAGCTVLFKGADTVIARLDGRAAISSAHHERTAPWLATAGAGDVLSGMIAGLLARGFEPMAAAETAAWLHVEAARRFGSGLVAEDIPEQLPAVFRDLGV